MTPVLLSALNALGSTLRPAFNQATTIACHEAWRRARPRAPQEPDLVAMPVLEGTPYLAKALQSTLPPLGIEVAVSSIFCHQRPMVEFGRGTKRCELGDVLFVHVHTAVRPNRVFRNSLLLQAKMTSQAVTQISSNRDQVQLQLYEDWPRFKYIRSGTPLNNEHRDVFPKSRHSGAQYLLVDAAGTASLSSGLFGIPGTYPMAVWPAFDTLCTSHPLADELLRFLMGSTGREFVGFGEKDSSGWSEVIWDLLTYGVSSTFNRSNVGVRSVRRSAGDTPTMELDGACFCAPRAGEAEEAQAYEFRARTRGLTLKRGEPPTGDSARFLEDPGEFSGVSVVLIETSEAQAEA